MVSVVQLVERQIVVLVVVGSSPTVHPPKNRLLSEVCFFVCLPSSNCMNFEAQKFVWRNYYYEEIEYRACGA